MTYLSQLQPDERIAEINRIFRNVFSSEEGKIVLTAILEDLRYFDPPDSPDDRILRDFATYLAGRVFTKDSYALVGAMLAVKE